MAWVAAFGGLLSLGVLLDLGMQRAATMLCSFRSAVFATT